MQGRRNLLKQGAALGALAVFTALAPKARAATPGDTVDFKSLTEADWKTRLNEQQFYILRKHGTERPGTSPLDREKRKGTFACAGCELPLFASDTKFDSGTGWPSFYAPLTGAVGTKADRSMFMTRTEVHCSRCIGHLGHVFDDGPKPTGLRYCMNGVAMQFKPAAPSAT